MKTISNLFLILAVLLSDVMCAVVAYNYCDMMWGIKYAGYFCVLLLTLPNTFE